MSNYYPFNYGSVNLYNAWNKPTEVHTFDNATNWFFERTLFQRFCSIWDWKIPDLWQKPFMEWVLYMGGFMLIFREEKYGIIPMYGTFTGFNVFYFPTDAQVRTNLLSRTDLKIGENCAIVRLAPDFFGVADIIHYYAEKLTLASQALDMNLINSKLANVFAASNKGEAEAIKAVLDKIYSGEPAAVYEPGKQSRGDMDPWKVFNRDIKAGFIAPDLLQVYRSIFREFDTEIGIPNANTEKRERLITDEVNQNNAETMSRVKIFEQTMQRDIKEAKRIFPDLEMSVKLAAFVLPGQEVKTDEENYLDRNV